MPAMNRNALSSMRDIATASCPGLQCYERASSWHFSELPDTDGLALPGATGMGLDHHRYAARVFQLRNGLRMYSRDPNLWRQAIRPSQYRQYVRDQSCVGPRRR